MERRLFVLRHAKSSWDDPGVSDHDRPLAPRGQEDLPKLARALDGRTDDVSVVLCSSATRTVATLEGIRTSLPADAAITIDEAFYLASANRWLEAIRALPSSCRAVLLLGHNPGMQELIEHLTGSATDPARAQLESKVPTGALAELVHDGSWEELARGSCHLAALQVPRELN